VRRAHSEEQQAKSAARQQARPLTVVTRRVKRICILTSIHPDYDARVFRHARSVAEAGYEVDLICPWEPPVVQIPPNLRIIAFERVTNRLLRPGLIVARILPHLVAKRYDLYHFHDLDLLPLMTLVKLATLRNVIYDCHENYEEEMLTRSYRIPRWSRRGLAWGVKWTERVAAGVLREVVIVTPQQRRIFPAPWFHTALVRNFAELGLERGRVDDLETRPDACISTASQYVSNGALLFVEVAREVVRRRPHVKFYAVDRFGTDLALREQVLARVREAGLGANFSLLPNVSPPAIMTLLNRATIGLSINLPTPKQVGALPIKLVEYMAAKLPVVASDLPNIRQLAQDAGNMLLASPGDVKSFADCICELVDDKPRARILGERGLHSFRKRLHWEVEMEKMLEMYRRLLEKGS
jgi:glycosyltransferase involved in cell wall biosynthesis